MFKQLPAKKLLCSLLLAGFFSAVWAGATTTWFRVDPAEDMTYMVNAQTLPSDQNLIDMIQNLIYQALIE